MKAGSATSEASRRPSPPASTPSAACTQLSSDTMLPKASSMACRAAQSKVSRALPSTLPPLHRSAYWALLMFKQRLCNVISREHGRAHSHGLLCAVHLRKDALEVLCKTVASPIRTPSTFGASAAPFTTHVSAIYLSAHPSNAVACAGGHSRRATLLQASPRAHSPPKAAIAR